MKRIALIAYIVLGLIFTPGCATMGLTRNIRETTQEPHHRLWFENDCIDKTYTARYIGTETFNSNRLLDIYEMNIYEISDLNLYLRFNDGRYGSQSAMITDVKLEADRINQLDNHGDKYVVFTRTLTKNNDANKIIFYLNDSNEVLNTYSSEMVNNGYFYRNVRVETRRSAFNVMANYCRSAGYVVAIPFDILTFPFQILYSMANMPPIWHGH